MLTIERLVEMAHPTVVELATDLDIFRSAGGSGESRHCSFSFLTERPIRANVMVATTLDSIRLSMRLIGGSGKGFNTTLIRSITDEATFQKYLDFAQVQFEKVIAETELYDN